MKPPAREPPADDVEDIDPGLAHERTELAWTRTAISFAAVGATLLRYRPGAGVPILILSAVVWWLGRLPRTPGADRKHDKRLLLIMVSITGISMVALVLSFLGHGTVVFH